MNEPILTLVGNLADDPELRFTPSGVAVAKLRMAMTPRNKNAAGEWVDGEPFWQDVTAWREMAENVAESLRRGDRVIVTGRLKQREYEAQDGTKRRVTELEADAIGPDLWRATTKVTRVRKTDGNGGGESQARKATPAKAAPAQAAASPADDW